MGWTLIKIYSFKYFLKIAFVRGISLEYLGGFGRYRHEWVKVWNTLIFINKN